MKENMLEIIDNVTNALQNSYQFKENTIDSLWKFACKNKLIVNQSEMKTLCMMSFILFLPLYKTPLSACLLQFIQQKKNNNQIKEVIFVISKFFAVN